MRQVVRHRPDDHALEATNTTRADDEELGVRRPGPSAGRRSTCRRSGCTNTGHDRPERSMPSRTSSRSASAASSNTATSGTAMVGNPNAAGSSQLCTTSTHPWRARASSTAQRSARAATPPTRRRPPRPCPARPPGSGGGGSAEATSPMRQWLAHRAHGDRSVPASRATRRPAGTRPRRPRSSPRREAGRWSAARSRPRRRRRPRRARTPQSSAAQESSYSGSCRRQSGRRDAAGGRSRRVPLAPSSRGCGPPPPPSEGASAAVVDSSMPTMISPMRSSSFARVAVHRAEGPGGSAEGPRAIGREPRRPNGAR